MIFVHIILAFAALGFTSPLSQSIPGRLKSPGQWSDMNFLGSGQDFTSFSEVQ